MLKKLFIQVGFYDDIEYWPQFLENRSRLAKYGWHWKIYTRLDLPGSDNVETVKIDMDWWNELIERKLGVKPKVRLIKAPYRNGKDEIAFTQPSKHVFTYWPAFGELFEEDTQNCDYWGHTGFNIVFGNLSTFIPDDHLDYVDIWSDDDNMIGGPCTLYKNSERMRHLFRECKEWHECFGDPTNRPYPFDEYFFSNFVREKSKLGDIKFLAENNHAFGEPDLSWRGDGLYNGDKEISFFHFTRTKVWPTITNQSA